MREKFAGIGFKVLIQGDEDAYPGWQPVIRQVKRMIPGSGVMVRQLMGSGMASVTLLLEFDSRADYMAVQALLGRTAELVLRSDFTNARGTTKSEDGALWEYLPNTTLDSLGPPSFEIGGAVTVAATFERAFDPATGKAE